MTVVAATKYVGIDELEILRDAGVGVVGRTGRRISRPRRAVRRCVQWHFIGHHGAEAKTVNDTCELCHSLASESAARRPRAGLMEVNLGRVVQVGIAPEELGTFL